MRYFSFFILLFSAPIFAAGDGHVSDNCPDPNPNLIVSEDVEKLKKYNCEEINALNKCRGREIDPDVLKKQFVSRLGRVEADKKRLIELLKQKKKVSTRNLFIEVGGTDKYRYFLDHFLEIDPSIDKQKMKEKVIEEYVKFSEKNDCRPKVKLGSIWQICPGDVETEGRDADAKREIEALLKQPDVEERRLKCLNNFRGDNAIKNGRICGTKTILQPRRVTARILSPCAGNFIQNFKDNKWDIPNIDELISSGAIGEKLLACLKKRVKRGAKIKKISIKASSSLLNNTGEAAKRFCKKGFKALSEARAEYAKEDMVPKILKAVGGESLIVREDQYKIDSNGYNKDGSSGPCPYRYENGQEILKKEFAQNGSRRQELEKAKFLKVSISFEELRTPVSGQKTKYRPRHRCRTIEFQCAD